MKSQGDPCGDWSVGDTPGRTIDISNPGDSSDTSADLNTPACTTGTGSGRLIDDVCVSVCVYGDLTDPDSEGVLDDWGWEMQAECIVGTSDAALAATACEPPASTDLPAPGDGYWFPEVGDPPEPRCVPPCQDPASDTEPIDGSGREFQDTCIVPGSRAAAEGIPCVVETETCTGNGYVISTDTDENPDTPNEDVCVAPCQYGDLTDVTVEGDPETCTPDDDGWGWEMQKECIVPGSTAAPQNMCCDLAPRPELPPGGDGYMIDDDDSGVFGDGTDVCVPPCADSSSAADSCTGWGYENGLNCIVPGSIAAAQTVPCVYEALTTDPPSGTGWDGNYTTTFFGEVDCQSLGADDTGNSDLNCSACVSNGAVTLSGDNQTYFGALGDHSSLWEGGECTCSGAEPCIPTCPSTTCGRCYEVACNPGGTYYHPDDENQDTHNGNCRVDQSVVVEIIDVCPHNRTNNTYWCTDQRPDHIDISCTAFTAITNGRQDIDNIGSLNVWVRQVDCSVGLGVKPLDR